MITVRELTKEYRSKRVLDGLDFEVGRGEFVAVVGESGTGKTTLLNILGGLDSDFSGEATVAGCDLGALSDARLSNFRNQTIGLVFQESALLPSLSVLDNLLLPTLFASTGGNALTMRARTLLAEVGLENRDQDSPELLSGGERQRLGLARALMMEPDIVLCDEMTGNLDSRSAHAVLEILLKIRDEFELTIVAATHDHRVVEAADRSQTLVNGRLE